ncbi:unnamed protein product [Effrenium voratum]|nr:unnamed protein product [Effrenium voratum]
MWHQDPSFLSLLLHGSEDPPGQGLEVHHEASRRFLPLPRSGCGVATILVGQLFHLLCGRGKMRFAKGAHRVVTRAEDMDKPRLCATFFFQPHPDALLRPLVPGVDEPIITFRERRLGSYSRFTPLDFDEPPSCQRTFPTDGCYEPEEWPTGYARFNGTGDWICADGYVGTPQETCVPDEPCGASLQLSACLPQQPCQALQMDSCRYEAVGCSGVLGGETCEIRCRAPAEGDSALASCPELNTDPAQELIYTLPSCIVPSCPNPVPLTAGYEEEENGTLACAEKFAGTPEAGRMHLEESLLW